MSNPTYIDLFAGAGGLSEGFIRAGYKPVTHVEMDTNACETIKTRLSYHFLNRNGGIGLYNQYLLKEITREKLYSSVPQSLLNTVINCEISNKTIHEVFELIDKKLGNKELDVIIGGPPCQAYSLIGRARDTNNMNRDKRNFLFKYYAEFLKHYRPKYFVFENVTGLLSAKNYLNQMINLFQSKKVGYSVEYRVLDSSNYDVVQNRKRVIVIGKQTDRSFEFPIPESKPNNWKTRQHIFSDLPEIIPGEYSDWIDYSGDTNSYLTDHFIRNGSPFVTQHIARPHNQRDLEIYRIAIEKWLNEGERLHYNELPAKLKTHKKEDIFLDRFKVVNHDGLSHTMVAHIAKDGHYYIYPDLNQIRSISVREAARIQSFPDDFFFEGGRTAAFRQIGNAVPPLMAQAFARKLKELF
ncbi:MAG: DNA (cytosine-5-)-methyltransferase [Bacteroidales bacterium]|nr:DNA (cytosine-5-)-methyltransferase [Bacteroidales bacterium]